MHSDFSIQLPLNGSGYGQMSVLALFEIFKRNLTPNVFPIGEIDLRAFDVPEEFPVWLEYCIKKANKSFSRKQPALKIWHPYDLKERLSDYQVAWVAHESSLITPSEQNILKNLDKVLVVSNYVKKVFGEGGIEAQTVPNFFDARHLKRINVKRDENVTHWSLIGKLEKRKRTVDIIRAWVKLYGNRRDHVLHLSINNPWIFKDMNSLIGFVVNQIGGLPFNLNFIPHLEKNAQMNEVYNVADVNLSGGSSAEGFNLPFFNSLALGKQCVSLNAHAHLDFATEENSILFEPTELMDMADGIFFKPGEEFNQGKQWDWNESDLLMALEKAEKVAKNRNVAGELLKEQFSVERTVDLLLDSLK